jgi:hypothetical protein
MRVLDHSISALSSFRVSGTGSPSRTFATPQPLCQRPAYCLSGYRRFPGYRQSSCRFPVTELGKEQDRKLTIVEQATDLEFSINNMLIFLRGAENLLGDMKTHINAHINVTTSGLCFILVIYFLRRCQFLRL